MSLTLPVLYHWSPLEARAGIVRRGLKPRTPTAVWVRPWRPGVKEGHHHEDVEAETLKTVCLGTTPSTAWCYSAAFSPRDSVWDLWEVKLDADDEVHYRPTFGPELDEVRVANSIPKSRIWHVGTRTVGRYRVRSNPV